MTRRGDVVVAIFPLTPGKPYNPTILFGTESTFFEMD
jgi:hypothetical protein